jgi:hypothetical protein
MLRLTSVALALLVSPAVLGNVSVSGSLKKWHPITVDTAGATAVLSESQLQPNPFLDFRYNVVFTSPGGNEYIVPGYFAGDGVGGGIGSVWRAKFSAGETGEWQYRISFQRGDDLSVSEADGTPMPSDGESGSFTVTDNSPQDPGFLATGRLQYTGEHYLKFADGPYWIKGGVDSPENFFGYAGFDNTFDQPGGADTGVLFQGVHHYVPHIADWREGDPVFTNSANPDNAKGIIGAVNYLASEGINSLYFLPMNLGGDGRETYPFIRPTGSPFDNTHYDVSKLFQWQIVLEHMQRKGIAAHFVLAEQEGRNTNWLDDGQLGIERKLFYREMIARFAYLLAIKWNISEESRYGDSRHKEFAGYIQDLDWADFPIAVHTNRDRPAEKYDGLLGDPRFAASSIQFSRQISGALVEEWRQKTADAGWPWVIDMDEVGPAFTGLTPDNTEDLRKSVLYPVYFSGGNLEWYFGYHPLPLGGDMRTEDFRTRRKMYRYTRIAREMMQAALPFWRMQPADDLYTGDTTAEVFAEAGSAYAVYLADASSPGTLAVEPGDYQLQWFDPRNGEYAGEPQVISAGATVALGTAPSAADEDWVVLLTQPPSDNEQPAAPEETETEAETETETEANSAENREPTEEPASPETGSPDAPQQPQAPKAESVGSFDAGFGALLLLLLTWRRQRSR